MLDACSSLFFLFLWAAVGSWAQDTDAQCLEQFSWMRNSLGQSPCLVDAFVEGACHSDEQWSVPAAQGPSSIYPGPSVQSANTCGCSSVAFSLLSACAFCQGASLNSWSNFIANCSAEDITNPGYPHAIPSGTTISSWAFALVDTDADKWDPANAKSLAFAGAPDFSASNPPPTSGDSSSAITPSSSVSPSSTLLSTSTSPSPGPTADHSSATSEQTAASASTTPSPTSSASPVSTAILSPTPTNANTSDAVENTKRKTPVGAIVGGIIGGILAFLLLCGAAILTYRYLRTPRAGLQHYRRKGSVSTNGSGSRSSYGHDDKLKYPEPPNSAGLPHSPLSIYDPFRSTSSAALTHHHHEQDDEDADLDNRFFNVPPHQSLPPEDFEFTHAV